jgi:rod shape-determining protein MreD
VLLAVAAILLSFILQNSILPLAPGVDMVPNLFLVITVAYGFNCGKRIGMVIGLICGLICDVFHGDGGLGFYMLIYVYVGAFCGIFTGFIHREEHLFSLMLTGGCSIAFGLYVYVFRFMLRGRLNLMTYVGNTILPEAIYTLIAAVVIYPLVSGIDQHLILTTKRRTSSFV